MKLYVSTDIEGVAGIVHWDQVMPMGSDYEMGRRLLAEELSVLCRGAVIAGATDIVVNDAHGPMRNIPPDSLSEKVRLITGHFKPMYMMEGLDETFDAAVFLGYHGAAGAASTLSHTYSPRAIWEARINGEITGETGINALVAHHFGVPVVLITGDDRTVDDAKAWIPEAKGICVKRSVSRFSAESISPASSRELIFDGIQGVLGAALPKPRGPRTPIQLELTFLTEDMAVLAEWSGAKRTGARQVTVETESGLDAYRRFHIILLLTRVVQEN